MPGVLGVVAAVVAGGAIALAAVSPETPPPTLTTSAAGVAAAPSRSGAAAADTLTDKDVLGVTASPRRQAVVTEGVPVPRSRFRWPLDPRPRVLRRFTVGPDPWSPGHRGVDLAASAGRPVLAAGSGVISFAGSVAGVGAVSVTHDDGLRTTYEPVHADVHAGDKVSAGERLGTVAAWPEHCGSSCLHWGAIRGRTYVDPLVLLGLVPPVLLPLLR